MARYLQAVGFLGVLELMSQLFLSKNHMPTVLVFQTFQGFVI